MKSKNIVLALSVTTMLTWAIASAEPTPTLTPLGAPSRTSGCQTPCQIPAAPYTAGQQALNLLFAGLTAIGTLSVAILALFGPRIRSWFIRPILRFNVDSKKCPFVELLDSDDENTSSDKKKYYEIRIEIANTGKDPARNCRVRVNAIYRQKSQANDYYAAKEFVPRYLYWAKKDTKSEEPMDILPKLPEYFVIGRLIEQEQPTTKDDPLSANIKKSLFGLEIAIEPEGVKGRFYFVGSGKVVIPFLVYADNLRTYEQIYVELFWDGQTITDYSEQHFGVKLLTKVEGDAIIGRKQ